MLVPDASRGLDEREHPVRVVRVRREARERTDDQVALVHVARVLIDLGEELMTSGRYSLNPNYFDNFPKRRYCRINHPQQRDICRPHG